MADISTVYAGLSLRSPLIVASSGLTQRAQKIRQFEEAGAGAIVLKSIFEEQMEAEATFMSTDSDYPEAMDYLRHYVKSNALSQHLYLIKSCLDTLSIPVIASINCYKSDTWIDYAHQIAESGVAALELNVMRIDTDVTQDIARTEEEVVRMVKEVTEHVKIPVTVKVSKFYSNICRLSRDLNIADAAGIVMFNRMYTTDIDIKSESIVPGNVFSHPHDLMDSLRFTALVKGCIEDFSVGISTGVRTGEDVVKCLLAGADGVQLCSAIYQKGAKIISEMNDYLHEWMGQKKYMGIEEFKGRLAATRVDYANTYQRSQFMKHFSNYDESPLNAAAPSKSHPNLPY